MKLCVIFSVHKQFLFSVLQFCAQTNHAWDQSVHKIKVLKTSMFHSVLAESAVSAFAFRDDQTSAHRTHPRPRPGGIPQTLQRRQD